MEIEQEYLRGSKANYEKFIRKYNLDKDELFKDLIIFGHCVTDGEGNRVPPEKWPDNPVEIE